MSTSTKPRRREPTITSGYADELREVVRGLAADAADEADAGEPSGPALWDRLAELGMTRLDIPETAGGSGGTFDDLLALTHALARHAVTTPVAESATADRCLASGDTLPTGATALALLPAGITGPGPDGTITAQLPAVPWASGAHTLLLVPAAEAAGASDAGPWTVDLTGPGVTRHPSRPALCGTPYEAVGLTAAPVHALPPGAPSPAHLHARLAVLRSAALLGAAEGAYELTAAHVTQREQFGAPLLKIPAVAAHLATMRVHLLQAEAALHHARDTYCGDASGQPDAARLAAAAATARITAATTATEVARSAHQLHGALGITAEYPLHRYTRRLWAWRDTPVPQQAEAVALGRLAIAAGEPAVWDVLTAPAPH
ncbi:acyl-CoA dehydrogenase family protein [Streptomyces endophyticus]|uniref:Acyl-CoA/acyl-ACP dehydrogenase n=1 Tax=Streptomyces endophyticus TaxID=714166 RepID=A0ABU6F3B8_9ACTN|nr:acyl-CoA dehydrogenase family protein [Streptomyces endophyticus]MEB8338498.1 acyl-CoA/acyl-ACP dehydrogenase [Streptomyces endophyticus]